MKVPRLQFPSFCWLFVFHLALTQQTQGANTTPVLHIFICTFFSELKNTDCKKLHKAVCLQQSSFTPVFCVCMCADNTPARNWLLNFTWEHLCKTHWDYATSNLPHICFFARVSMPSCLSCWSGEQPVLSREGSCLAGATGSGPRDETSTGIFWRRLSVSHASSCA